MNPGIHGGKQRLDVAQADTTGSLSAGYAELAASSGIRALLEGGAALELGLQRSFGSSLFFSPADGNDALFVGFLCLGLLLRLHDAVDLP